MNSEKMALFRDGAARGGLLAVLFFVVTPAAWMARKPSPVRLFPAAKEWAPMSVTTRDPNPFYGRY